MCDTITTAANTNKFFYIRIPGCYVFITNRPIDGDTLFCVCFEIEITPSLGPSCPQQRFATELVSSYPVKGLCLHVRMFIIFHKKMLSRFSKCVTFTDNRIFLAHLSCQVFTVR